MAASLGRHSLERLPDIQGIHGSLGIGKGNIDALIGIAVQKALRFQPFDGDANGGAADVELVCDLLLDNLDAGRVNSHNDRIFQLFISDVFEGHLFSVFLCLVHNVPLA